MKTRQNENLRQHRRYGMTMLQMMALFMAIGVVGEVLVCHFF